MYRRLDVINPNVRGSTSSATVEVEAINMVAFTLVHEYLQVETSMKVGGLFRIQSNIRVCTFHDCVIVCSWE